MSPDPTWAGRLPGGLDPEAWGFLHSLPHDRHLWADDVDGTAAHVHALEEAGILTEDEATRLRDALSEIRGMPDAIEDTDEDVHSAIERVLTERLGDLGAKVHAGRSRNDQVACAMRLWARREVGAVRDAVAAIVAAIADRAHASTGLLCPGYTHLQRAQPVTVAHWLCAHGFAFARDLDRLDAALDSADVSPLGAGALAGSTLGLDPEVPARVLGFTATFENTQDAVSDRDYLCDAAYACAMAQVHLSRLAEELFWWSSAEVGFVHLPDAHATGSSMMPQKKNPDVAELARGQTGPAVAALTGLLVTLKGLPLAYDRDLQADKQILGDVLGSTTRAFRAMAGLVSGIGFDAGRLEAAAADDALCATDLAEGLVRAGVPFRRAHEQVGEIARRASDGGTTLRDVVRSDPETVAPLDPSQAAALLDPAGAVERRSTPGGPSPSSVFAQIERLRARATR